MNRAWTGFVRFVARAAGWGLALLALGLAVLTALDRLALALAWGGLVYPANTSVHYATSEFEFRGEINDLGFRGPSVATAAPSGKPRIVVLGDSFTYGWGVDLADAWPAVLERELNERGFPSEVLNLGGVGMGPADYARVAQAAAGRLRPDLMIIAVLQADDLQQVRRSIPFSRPRTMLYRLFPSLARALQPARRLDAADVRDEWVIQARRAIAKMSSLETARYGSLDGDLRRLFTTGRLNPFLIDLAVRKPDYFVEDLILSAPRTQAAIERFVKQMKRVKRAGAKVGSEVVIVGVPHPIFVGEGYVARLRRLGFETRPGIATSEAPDEIIGRVAQSAGLRHWTVTAEFRRSTEPLYFELDQHFSPAGNRLFATLVAPHIERELRSVRRGDADPPSR